MKKWIFAVLLLGLLAACQKVPGLAGSKWELVDMADQALIDGTRASLEFAEDGSAGGFAGCNSFGAGEVLLKGESLEFTNLFQTEMACVDESGGLSSGVMDQESRYIQALGRVSSYTMEGDALALLDNTGTRLMLFEPV